LSQIDVYKMLKIALVLVMSVYY